MSDRSQEIKEKAKDALRVVAAEADETYDSILEKVVGDHKPTVGRSRLFVAGLLTGVVLSVIVAWIF